MDAECGTAGSPEVTRKAVPNRHFQVHCPECDHEFGGRARMICVLGEETDVYQKRWYENEISEIFKGYCEAPKPPPMIVFPALTRGSRPIPGMWKPPRVRPKIQNYDMFGV